MSSVYFPNVDTGYAVGVHGSILKTVNAGTTWSALTSGTTNDLYSVYFTDSHTGYVTGEGGSILKTIDGGGFPVGVKKNPPNSSLLQIFPNPTNGKIIIRMVEDLPYNSDLIILNIYGKELLNKRITEQATQIDISDLPSGMYVVRIKNERSVQLTKVIKE